MSKVERPWDVARILSRRDALKSCLLLPAGALTAGRLLTGCSDQASMVNGIPMTSPMGVTSAGGSGAPAMMPPAMMPKPMTMPPAQMPKPPMMPPTAPMMGTPMAGGPAMPMGMGGNGAMMPMMPGGAAGMGGMMDVAGPGVAWASGGTKSMMGNYPNPFKGDMGAMCKVYPTQTLGPCYADGPEVREDISDGKDGLPTRLSLMIVDSSCKPIPNASVDIWAAGPDGAYSDYAAGTICNPAGGSSTMGQMFGRGVQMSDEAGQLNFNTVFPGWYRGRTLHIHFTIRVQGRELTSQLYFDDMLVDEILSQGYYKPRGMRDTNNMRDGIFRSGGASADQVLFQTAKRPDGVLHAWKVISLG